MRIVHTEVEAVYCPECGAKFSETVRHDGFRAGSTSIGPAALPCRQCGCLIVTGQSEWDDKTFAQQVWFVMQRTAWMLGSSLVFASVVAYIVASIATEYWNFDRAHEQSWQLKTFCVGTFFVAVVFFRNAAREIRESRRRKQAIESE